MFATLLLLATPAPAAGILDTAAPGDQPESWVIEYDIAMIPYLEDYRRCLNYGHRVASGAADFEAQHRSDIPRCQKVADKAIAKSNEAIERRGRSELMTPEMVARAFAYQGTIHIGRGRNIDQQFTRRVAAFESSQDRIFTHAQDQ